MSPAHFEQAVLSLRGYFGVCGVFGGNPATSPHFIDYCEIMRRHIPYDQRGLWCNNPITPEKAVAAKETFNPAVSNLNVHLDQHAYDLFKLWWPDSRPFGLDKDSRHSPCYVAMKDVIADEGERWRLISDCDINRHWSAMIGVFRGELRAWFCEIAGAQAMLHQWDQDKDESFAPLYLYPDTGLDPNVVYDDGEKQWWQLPMHSFAGQVRKHCHECSVPLKGYGELAQSQEGKEQVSATHAGVYVPKTSGRQVEVVGELVQLDTGRLQRMTDYIGNSQK